MKWININFEKRNIFLSYIVFSCNVIQNSATPTKTALRSFHLFGGVAAELAHVLHGGAPGAEADVVRLGRQELPV